MRTNAEPMNPAPPVTKNLHNRFGIIFGIIIGLLQHEVIAQVGRVSTPGAVPALMSSMSKFNINHQQIVLTE
jgi:hypothetical protein